jgi:hypothetical protein
MRATLHIETFAARQLQVHLVDERRRIQRVLAPPVAALPVRERVDFVVHEVEHGVEGVPVALRESGDQA